MYTIEEFDQLKTKILKYVIYKKRTEKEIRRKFQVIDDTNLLDDVIEHLKEIGYINDRVYLQRAVSEHMALHNLSLKELKYKLCTKGISGDSLQEYLAENEEEMQLYEIQSAKNICIKKCTSMDEEELKQFLLKKGYQLENIKQALSEVI